MIRRAFRVEGRRRARAGVTPCGSSLWRQRVCAPRGWEGAEEWAEKANKIAPTIVGRSKKHGGADLGPTRAKRAWARLGVDALGVANHAPEPGDTFEVAPKLTCEMVARIQGWRDEWGWEFTGRKTSRYRQIGNAFPPPVARAVGEAIARALQKKGTPREREVDRHHDPLYPALRDHDDYMTVAQPLRASGLDLDVPELEHRMALLSRDFEIAKRVTKTTTAYKLGQFKAFMGQEDHDRHDRFLQHRARRCLVFVCVSPGEDRLSEESGGRPWPRY
ncbi:DNA cytosine methyltransferase [Actinomadura sp. NAK00032]|uniref:DNA cytosine methyltransferase n=1 Tax=Actinomadura sp. NAK00032 TaxID=2742128 RepID=UPI0034A2F668